MINFTTINILGQPNFVLDLKKEYGKTLKKYTNVSEGCLRIGWKCMKIVLTV